MEDDFTEDDLAVEPLLQQVHQWTELEPMLLSPTEVSLLSQRAFLFCLPAYMLGGVRWSSYGIDSLLNLLYTPGTPWDSCAPSSWRIAFGRWDKLMRSLNGEQKHVIRLWLEILADAFPRRHVIDDSDSRLLPDRVRTMLRNYWAAY